MLFKRTKIAVTT